MGCASLFAQTTIKYYYALFPYQFKESEAMGSMANADTIVDIKNAYLHIQSKPNDCCTDYITFTFFKTQAGNKLFAYEKGASTTASDDYTTLFYTYRNDTWTNVTDSVFPFKFTFRDFYKPATLPKAHLQQFQTHIELPKTGTNVTVHVTEKNVMDWDELFPEPEDLEAYEKLFTTKGLFYKLIYKWDKTTGTFKLKEKQPE